MLRMMIAAAALLTSAAASATSSITVSDDRSRASINYSDLNLGSRVDRTRLTSRIQRAAGLLCLDPYNIDPVIVPPTRAECYRVAVESGIEQMEEIAAHAAG